jgi:ATP/maltotriose-dependent transcriptional regulator MalT
MAADTVRRERLLSLAQTAADVPLTLVSAPAGCGKSTLASQWLGLIGCRSAWLSLDPVDSDLTQFLSKVLAACDWKIRGKDGAAEHLGLKRTTLQSRMKKLGIVRPTT